MPQELSEEMPVENIEDVEVVVDEPVDGEVIEAPKDDLEQYGDSVQKRINKLTAKMREAERREQAALEYAQSLQYQAEQRIAQESTKAEKLDHFYVNEFQNRITTQNELLRGQLKDAIDRGDSETQVELQKQMADIANQETKLKQVRAQQERKKAMAQQQAQYAQMQSQMQPQMQPQAPVQQAPQPDAKAEDWANKNEWFGEDEAMTLTAFSIHKTLIEEEGYDAVNNSDAYYAELDKRIRDEFPHKFGQKTTSNSPKVAGATRNSSPKGRKSVKLNASQIAIAKKLNVPLEKYAAQLERLNNS
tara:strand:- start:101 stop:1012 length:912 start_codon:yes stop_codon:yes gene_type:complete